MPKQKPSLLRPRPYLSWSQLWLWESDPDAYIRRYVYGESHRTREMDFGSRIADGLAKPPNGDPQVELARSLLPEYPQREAVIESEYFDVPLMIRMDQWDEQGLRIGEVKTGKQRWTPKRVEEWGQLTFYAMTAWRKFGSIPKIILYWLPTVEMDEEIELVGVCKGFDAKREQTDLVKMGLRARKAWAEIGKVYTNEINSIS